MVQDLGIDFPPKTLDKEKVFWRTSIVALELKLSPSYFPCYFAVILHTAY